MEVSSFSNLDVKRLQPIQIQNGKVVGCPELLYLFRQMCSHEENKARYPKLSSENVREFLAKRYDKHFVKQILKALNLYPMMRDYNFAERMNKFLGTSQDAKLRFCFDLYDFNCDGRICEVDLHRAFRNLKELDYFLNDDISKMTKQLRIKKELEGIVASTQAKKQTTQFSRNLSLQKSHYTHSRARDFSAAASKEYFPKFDSRLKKKITINNTPIRRTQHHKTIIDQRKTPQLTRSFQTNAWKDEEDGGFVSFVAQSLVKKREEFSDYHTISALPNLLCQKSPPQGSSLVINMTPYEIRRSTLFSNQDLDEEMEMDPEAILKFNLRDTFDRFTSQMKYANEADYLTFEDFKMIDFENMGYPEILHDILYYVASYKMLEVNEVEDEPPVSPLQFSFQESSFKSPKKTFIQKKKTFAIPQAKSRDCYYRVLNRQVLRLPFSQEELFRRMDRFEKFQTLFQTKLQL